MGRSLIMCGLFISAVNCAHAQTDNLRSFEVQLVYDTASHSLKPMAGAETPVVTNGDELSMELVKSTSFPVVVVRRIAYCFNYKTKHKKRRGGIAGFFGGKTTVITDHPTWVIVDVEAKSLGKNGEIAIAVRAKGEEPFFPTPKERKKKIAQITKGGGPVDISGSITADANGFARANEKIIQEYVNPSGGYELSCLNQTSPEVVEAGQTSKTITFSFEGKPVVETLSAPGPLTFAVKVSVRGSE